VSDTQRNGSIAGIAVVLGFSLQFTATWSEGSDPWRYRSLIVMAVVTAGVVLQLRALFRVFTLPVLAEEEHRRAGMQFFRGVAAVLSGYALHIILNAAADLGFLPK
jgi:hypothetical protein